jgi:hypothetical protein
MCFGGGVEWRVEGGEARAYISISAVMEIDVACCGPYAEL